MAPAHPAEVARLAALLWAWMERDPELVRRGDMLVPRPGVAPPADEPGLRIGAP